MPSISSSTGQAICSQPVILLTAAPLILVFCTRTRLISSHLPKLKLIDRGAPNIDTTVCKDPISGYYHRFSKAYSTKVIQERSLNMFGTWELVFEGIGYADHGQVEGPLCFVDNLNSSLFHVWVDDIADLAGEVQGYLPYQSGSFTGCPST